MPLEPPGYLLAVDTSADPCSVAVLGPQGAVAERVAAPGERAGGVLHRLVEGVLADAGIELAALRAIAAVRGPGSFTGLRVGLAAVQGLALARSLPVAGLGATEVVAAASGLTGRVLAVIDGGQGHFFAAEHEVAAGGVSPGAVEDLAPAALAERARSLRVVVRGDAQLPAGCEAAARVSGGLAAVAARLAASVEPAHGTLEPLYARAPAIRPPAPPRPIR